MATELALRNVVAGYGGTIVIDGLSLCVRQGERVGILGRNGAGKTTTLATALGLTHLVSGTIEIDGVDVSRMKTSVRVRKGIGYVPQTRDIFPSLTVVENLLSGLQGGSGARLNQAFELFPRLAERSGNYGDELSGGEQQMLSIARALMGAPSILLLDEPLEGLSPLIAKEVMDGIRLLVSERGLGCVLVEQHVASVMEFASTVLVLERGRAVFCGTSEDLALRGDILEASIGLAKTHRSEAS